MLCQSDLHKARGTKTHYQVIFTTCSQNKSSWECCCAHTCTHILCRMLRHVASLGAQTVKNPPAMWETWVQSLGWEDPLEEGMATYSGILAWRIPMDRGAWWAAIHGVEKSQTRLKGLSSGSLSLLQPIFPTQESNPGLPHCRRVL